MPPVGFEPTISAGERPKTYALDRAATGIGIRQRVIVISYRRLLTTYRSHVRNPNYFGFLTAEEGTDRLSRNVANKLPLLAL